MYTECNNERKKNYTNNIGPAGGRTFRDDEFQVQRTKNNKYLFIHVSKYARVQVHSYTYILHILLIYMRFDEIERSFPLTLYLASSRHRPYSQPSIMRESVERVVCCSVCSTGDPIVFRPAPARPLQSVGRGVDPPISQCLIIRSRYIRARIFQRLGIPHWKM